MTIIIIVIIFIIITTTSTVIIRDRNSKLIRSSYKYYFHHLGQQIHVGMDEINEVDQTYYKFYTQLAKYPVIVFILQY